MAALSKALSIWFGGPLSAGGGYTSGPELGGTAQAAATGAQGESSSELSLKCSQEKLHGIHNSIYQAWEPIFLNASMMIEVLGVLEGEEESVWGSRSL